MRRLWRALDSSALGRLLFVSVFSAAALGCLWPAAAEAGAAGGGLMALKDCSLEHPLRLASINASCGMLEVPLDRTRPGGPSIALSVAVVPALNRRSAGAPLFLLAGGPGQSAQAMYAGYAAAFARVHRNHDMVLVDQRGTGKLHAVVLQLSG